LTPTAPNPDRWRVIDDIFQAACDLDAKERPAYLDRACGADTGLRAEVESLLASAGQTIGIEQSVLDAARTVARGFAMVGQRIGPYELSDLIGEGGMGQVFLAFRADQAFSQRVAIKVMRGDFGRTREMLLRFRSERQILANLNHPNIARLLDGGVTPEGLPWLALEYVEGVPIDEHCRHQRLALDQRLELFLTVCAAVEYAHRNLVIHRDIKPANVMVTAEGVPKLLDFGIAKILSPDFAAAAPTRASERLMTPEYASPEQVRGEPVNTATDVYALGVLLYELLSGQRPFRVKTDSPLEIARAICEQTPDPPSVARGLNQQPLGLEPRRLKGDLDTIVLMAMRKEPERRYASVGQFSADIRAYLDGYPLLARGDSWHYRARTFVTRQKAAVAVAALAVLALTGFGIGMGVLARRADLARRTAERESQFLAGMFEAATPEQAHGKTITARDLLDRGAARVAKELVGEPQVEASMLGVIANAYRSLGVYDQSQALAQKAFNLALKNQGASSPEAAKEQELLAELQRDQAHYDKAEPLLRELIATRQKKGEGGDPQTAELMGELGECLYWQAKDDAALDVLRQALAIARKNGPDYGADARNYLALTLERKGNFEEAGQLLTEAVDINRRTLGADSPAYAISLQNLGISLVDRGDLYGAEQKLREVDQIQHRIMGAGHPDLVYVLNNLGYVLIRTGQFSAAEPFLKEAYEIHIKNFGPGNPRVAGPMHNLGVMMDARGDYAGARSQFEGLLAILKHANASNTWPGAQVISSLGWLEFDQGHYAAAQEDAQSAMDLRRKLGGEATPEFAMSLLQMSQIRLYQRDPHTAEGLLRQALAIRKKRYWAGYPDIATAEVRLGEALVAEKQAAQAEPLLRHALDALEHPAFRVPAWQVAEAKAAYGVCLQNLGRKAEGDALVAASRGDLRSDPRPILRGDPVARLRQAAL